MNDSLHDIAAATFGIAPEQLRADASMRNTPQWDSLRQVVLMLEIERRFGVKMSTGEMMTCVSLAQIADLLRARGAAFEPDAAASGSSG